MNEIRFAVERTFSSGPQQRRGLMGFTLIELVIAVAIVAILAAIAYPSYIQQIRKSRRAQAKVDITQLAQQFERNFTLTNDYTAAPTGASAAACSASLSNNSPSNGTTYYILTTGTCTPATYVITATPQGDQINDVLCGALSLDQTGARTPTTAGCWQ